MLNLGEGGRGLFSVLCIADGMVGTGCIIITAIRDTQVYAADIPSTALSQ